MAAIEQSGYRYLLWHGGAVAHGDAGILLSGASRSGKTTLMAGLIAAGFQYVGDEVAAVEQATLQLIPVAKCMCIKGGARDVLAEQYPALRCREARRRFGHQEVWYLHPPPQAWIAAPISVRYIIFPQYQPGAKARLTSMSRATALQRLLEQCFSPATYIRAHLGRVIKLLSHAKIFSLHAGNLRDAVTLLRILTEERQNGECR